MNFRKIYSDRKKHKSCTIAGKPCEAVQISICKATGELHTTAFHPNGVGKSTRVPAAAYWLG